MGNSLHRITGTVAGAMMLTLSSCSLGVKVREDWGKAQRQPIPLGEAAITWNELQRGVEPDAESLDRYNQAVRSSLVQLADNWTKGGAEISLLETTQGGAKLRVQSANLPDLAGADEIVPADFVRVRRGLRAESVVSGVGAPLIVRKARSESDPLIPETGLWVPVTAVLNLDKPTEPLLEFLDPTVRGTIAYGGRDYPLSANYTAAFARDFHDRQFQFESLGALLRFEEFADRMGIYRITPYHPDKEIVIFIHGINSSPSTWDEVMNRAYGDEAIRERYEFWTFGYPTGAPIPYMAAEFRDAIRKMLEYRAGRGARDQRITIVGHSMGGLIGKTMTFSSGDAEWSRLFKVPLTQLQIEESERETLRRMLYFEPIPEVKRVVFCASPHQGAEIVDHPGAKLVGDLIQVPSQLLLLSTEIIARSADALTPEGVEFTRDRLTSLEQLSGNAWTTSVFLNKPLNPAVTYHSIIGNNRLPHVPLEKAGDGVVPYRSAHLEGVASELVVRPSGHAVHRTDAGTEEILRILNLP
jgi:pimeloyl-ACP methyl ester carboxylesterase